VDEACQDIGITVLAKSAGKPKQHGEVRSKWLWLGKFVLRTAPDGLCSAKGAFTMKMTIRGVSGLFSGAIGPRVKRLRAAALSRLAVVLWFAVVAQHTFGVPPEGLKSEKSAAPPSLEIVCDAVKMNFDSIHDLRAETETLVILARKWVPGIVPRPDLPAPQPELTRFVWAFKGDDKEYVAGYRPVPAGTPMADVEPASITAYDGQSLRALFRPTVGPEQGFIMPPEEVWQNLHQQAAVSAKAGLAWGSWINGKSLVQWLENPKARIEGRQSVEGRECTIVNVPYQHPWEPGVDRALRLSLGDDLNYALVQYQAFKNDEKRITLTNTRFEEIAPGVWFPMKGFIDYGETTADSVPSTFTVTSVQANAGVPDELFSIDFKPGMTIFDEERDITFHWEQPGDDDLLEDLIPDAAPANAQMAQEKAREGGAIIAVSSSNAVPSRDEREIERRKRLNLFLLVAAGVLGLLIAAVLRGRSTKGATRTE